MNVSRALCFFALSAPALHANAQPAQALLIAHDLLDSVRMSLKRST
jgi:hypothetical protein